MTGGGAPEKNGRPHISIREIAVFAMLGALMFVSKQLMEGMPNIHMIGVLTMVYTIVYRVKALIPIYVFIFMEGVIASFNLWWIPYLYIWAVLWGVTMLLPRNMKPVKAAVVYPVVCGLHGLLYGTLYAPAQVILWFNWDFSKMIPWIVTGLKWDAIHCAGNLALGTLILPLSELLGKLEAHYKKSR